jgi:ribosomal protein S18 acetylase RimI-like enzyme
LGVRRGWRRRGIALALLHHTFREFQQRGQKRVGLGVDATSLTGANRVYEASGMRPTRRVTVYETVLREGTDPSVRTLADKEAET